MSEVNRYDIGGMTDGGIDVQQFPDGYWVKHEDYAALKAERDALAALAEERRQFIVNGVDMGDILLPVIDGDPAIAIHERCLLKPEFAYDAYLNSVRAEGVERVKAHPAISLCALTHVCEEIAAQLRAGEPS